MLPLTLLAIVLISLVAFALTRSRAVALSGGRQASLHSRPFYHGLYALLWVLIAGIGVFIVVDIVLTSLFDGLIASKIAELTPDLSPIQHSLIFSDAIKLASGGVASADDAVRREVAEYWASLDGWRIGLVCVGGLAAAGAAFYKVWTQIAVDFRARNRAERVMRTILLIAAAIAILTTIGIVLSLIGETLIFFQRIGWNVDSFLFGTTWSPLSGVQEGSLDPSKVGAVPLFVGTLMSTIIAMCVAVPVGLFAAVYLADFASK
ncbi:MAG: phosphate ABC transporter permease family protein, partial [Pseudomonadota bacterium]